MVLRYASPSSLLMLLVAWGVASSHAFSTMTRPHSSFVQRKNNALPSGKLLPVASKKQQQSVKHGIYANYGYVGGRRYLYGDGYYGGGGGYGGGYYGQYNGPWRRWDDDDIPVVFNHLEPYRGSYFDGYYGGYGGYGGGYGRGGYGGYGGYYGGGYRRPYYRGGYGGRWDDDNWGRGYSFRLPEAYLGSYY